MRLIIKPMGIILLLVTIFGLAGTTFFLLSAQKKDPSAPLRPPTSGAAPAPRGNVAMPLTNKPEKTAKISKVAESLVSNRAYTSEPPLNGLSYQQDALISFKGWQYCAYYSGKGTTRFVSIARRQLPSGKWESLELTDYPQTRNDEHALISMGICPKDGTIHISFDEHISQFQYRRSKVGVATTPTKFPWNASLFGPMETKLAGKELPSVAFPRFADSPSGNLLLEMRVGGAGVGDAYLFKYDGKGWKELGKYLDGSSANPYLNGIEFDPKGRLHVTWSWRRTGDPNTNNNLLYVYSDDEGLTWKNNEGKEVGKTGSKVLSTATPDIVAFPVPEASGLSSQESQTIDAQGRVHVLMHDTLSGDLRYVHFVRDTKGKWHRHPIAVPATQVRGQILTDAQGNAYAVLPNALITSSTPDNDYGGWWPAFNGNGWRMDGEPLWDRHRFKEDGKFSLFIRRNGTAELYVLDFAPAASK